MPDGSKSSSAAAAAAGRWRTAAKSWSEQIQYQCFNKVMDSL